MPSLSSSPSILGVPRVLNTHSRQVAVVAAVKEINGEASDEPDGKPQPGIARQAEHQKNCRSRAGRRHGKDSRRLERAVDLRMGDPQNENAQATDCKRKQEPILTRSPARPIGKSPARIATIAPVISVVT